MSSRLSDKTSKVVVVDHSGPVRQMMVDVIRTGLGFENAEGRPSIQEVLQGLEADADKTWLIVPLMADQPVNALHLLKICSETPELKHIRISLCIEESEIYVLPAAYELGLLSHHAKPFTKDSLVDELRTFLADLTGLAFKEPLVAAQYLRKVLKSGKKHAAQIELERALLDIYPGNPSVLLNIAEPKFHTGKKAEARKVLSQVKMIEPSLGDRVDELARAFFGVDAPKITGTATDLASDGAGANILGVRSCVVIDSDESAAKGVEQTLSALGVADIKRFSDGDSAWSALELGTEPDLIIMEWRIPKLSGPLLTQRIRSHGFLNVPIVILSSLLKADDMPLVREMGVAQVISKPLNKDLFIPSLVWVMQQERLPTESQSLERKIRSLLSSGKKEEAGPLRAQFLGNPTIPLAKKRLIEAEWAFAHGNYPLARDAAVDSLKLSGDSIAVLNLLGKTFMYLRSHAAALKCFKKAQDLSPQNIERLCQMAEAQTELGETAAAAEAIDHAKALDPDSKTVSEARVKVAITAGDTSTAKKIMSQIESLSNLVAYMNNKAVALAKCGFTSEAIELYRKTMVSIPDDRKDTKTIVRYNLALAMARAGELENAAIELGEVLKHKDSKVAKKAHSLRERLKAAVEKGQDMKFKGDSAAPGADGAAAASGGAAPGEEASSGLSSAADHSALMAHVDARRGDLCCFLIFNDPEPRDARVTSLFAKQPRFQSRDTIARSETLGADRAAKVG